MKKKDERIFSHDFKIPSHIIFCLQSESTRRVKIKLFSPFYEIAKSHEKILLG